MKKICLTIMTIALLAFATSAFAGVLMQQWTEGTTRYCQYSDGEVIAISFGSTCPATN